MFKTSYPVTFNHLFRLRYAISKIHDYPAEPSHVATLLSLFAKCKPYMSNTITRDGLRKMHDGSVNKNNMNGDFDDFLQTYSSGAKYAPILVFDGQHYHFDYATLTCFLLYLFSLNKHADGTQTVPGYTTFMQQRQKRAHIPPNKSARSQQWETGNRPSDLNEACLAAKGSLIRAAQTGHEIQADAQDSQD